MLKYSILFLLLPMVKSETSVTYPGIGTFTDSDYYHPIWRPFVALPQSPEEINPKFLLYTRKNLHEPEIFLYKKMLNLTSSKIFNPGLKTKFIVPGFIDNTVIGMWMEKLKNNLLIADDLNVILVDWSEANFFPYTMATANARVLGPMIGIIIENLCYQQSYRLTPESFHIIGHSLGAHVAGYIGKYLKGRLGHITGLDPAGPYFENLPFPEAKLWYTDARFVEAIHTDAKNFVGFGMYETCSHVDYFPNGGQSQPGCIQERITTVIMQGLIEGARRLFACSHMRSVDFYTEAILPTESGLPVAYACPDFESFQSGRCADCGKNWTDCSVISLHYNRTFVENLSNNNNNRNRRFFMSTASYPNYFRFQYLIRIKTAPKIPGHELLPYGQIMFRFVGHNETEEIFHFNEQKRYYEFSAIFSKIFVLNLEPASLSSVEMEWQSSKEYFTEIRIEQVEITALSHKQFQNGPIRHYFVPESFANEITNRITLRKIQRD